MLPGAGRMFNAGRRIKFARRKSLSILRTLLKTRILKIFFKVKPETPEAGSNLSEGKVFPIPNSHEYSNSEDFFQSKTSNLVKWTKMMSVALSFKLSAFYFNLWGFSLYFSFRKEPFKHVGHWWKKKPRQNGRKMTSFRGATAARQSWELAW